jgi:uncharacterized protein YrrD
MDVKSLKGIAVVSIASSEKLGSVDEVVIDTQEGRLGALRVGSGGLLRKDRQYVPFQAIRSIGADAVMVENEAVLQQSFETRASGYHSLENLSGLRVVTDGGTYIGNIVTVHFDEKEGRLTDFEIGQGGIGGLFGSSKVFGAESIVSIGRDIVIVPDHLFSNDVDAGRTSDSSHATTQ